MARRGVALVLVAVLVVAGMTGVLVGGQFLDSDQPREGPETQGPEAGPQEPDGPADGNEDEERGGQNDESDTTPGPPEFETDRPGVLNASSSGFAGFEEVATEVGLEYETSELGLFVDGYGAHVVDFDNDGYEDLLLIGGGGAKPVLFENTGGGYEPHQTFDHPEAMTAHFFDYNNNGYRDLLFARPGQTPVLYENVDGEFVQRDAGFDQYMAYPTTVTSADFTGNGCLDLYIGNWGGFTNALTTGELLEVGTNHPDVRPTTDRGSSNHLFAGDCESFEPITESAGVGGEEFALAVSAADFTGNGHVDLHVGNDWTGDHVYENQGNATFEEIDLGPASDRNAMASVAMDMTGNHRLDLFVTNVYYDEYDVEDLVPINRIALPEGNNLFVNDGGGEFHDVAPEHGLHRGSWGWAATVADYTNDGHLDVIHASSFADVAVVENHSDIFRPPQIWRGTTDSWEKVDGFDAGFQEHNLRGVARVDYENDGTLDFVAVGNPSLNLEAAEPGANRSFLYENQLDSDESLQLWVRNPDGLERNAEVYIETDERTIYREANARADHVSQDSRLIHVGTANEAVQRVTVVWPDGTVTEYETLSEGNRYILTPDGRDRVE